VLVDRFDRRRVMVTADLVRAGLALILVVTNQLWAIYLVVLLMETASLFFWPARNALIPYLVEEDDITAANGLAYTTQQASMLIGLAAAAGILAGFEAVVRAVIAADLPLVNSLVGLAAPALLGPRGGVILDSFTFLFSAAMISTIHVVARAERVAEPLDASLIGRDVVDSFRFLGEHRELRGLLVTVGLAILGGGAIIPVGQTYVQDNLTGALPFADRFQMLQQLTATPQTFMLVFMAIGMVGGALLAPRLEERFPLQILFAGSVIAFGGALLGFASVDKYWLAGIFAGGAGFCIATLTVAGNSYIVRTTSDDIRGRVFTAMEAVVKVALLLSMLIMAPLADLVGARIEAFVRANALAPTTWTTTGSRITLQFSAMLVIAAGIYGYRVMRWRECEEPVPEGPAEETAHVG
jgi:dTMP kinase